MILDILREKPPTLSDVTMFCRDLDAIASVLNSQAQIVSLDESEKVDNIMRSLDIIAGHIHELSAALDILDGFAEPEYYKFPAADPAHIDPA